MLAPGRGGLRGVNALPGEARAQFTRKVIDLAQRAHLHEEAARPLDLARALLLEVLLLTEVAPHLATRVYTCL